MTVHTKVEFVREDNKESKQQQQKETTTTQQQQQTTHQTKSRFGDSTQRDTTTSTSNSNNKDQSEFTFELREPDFTSIRNTSVKIAEELKKEFGGERWNWKIVGIDK